LRWLVAVVGDRDVESAPGFHVSTSICFFNLPTGAGISHRYLVGSKGLSFLTVDAAIVTSMPRFLLFLLRDTKRLDLESHSGTDFAVLLR
jgi:hypothetical protein